MAVYPVYECEHGCDFPDEDSGSNAGARVFGKKYTLIFYNPARISVRWVAGGSGF